MLKILIIPSILLTLCSCGSSSSSNSTGNDPNAIPDFPAGQSTLGLFYLNVPENYPKNGSAMITQTTSGFHISIPALETLGTSNIINGTDALELIRASCDNIASGGLNITFNPTDSVIDWTNISGVSGSLSITNEYIGSPQLREVTCIN